MKDDTVACCGRQNAKNVLNDLIKRKENEVQELKTLNDVIVWEHLSEEQESQLWSLLVKKW